MRKSSAKTAPAKAAAPARQRTTRRSTAPTNTVVRGPSILSPTTPSYWEWTSPPGSDYHHNHVNGRLHHPYRLPSVECETCGSWASHFYDVVLPAVCPDAFRKHPDIANPDARVTVRELEQLAQSMRLTVRDTFNARRWAGACLQPGLLDVPSKPKDDVLWSALWSGLSATVVSSRVRQAIEALGSPGLTFCPVFPGRIGKRSSKSPARIPKSGEPEDMFLKYAVGKGSAEIDGYSQLLITAEALPPPGAEPKSTCPTCGEEEQPDWNAKDRAWKELTADRIASLAPDLVLFRIPDRGTLFVADRLKGALERLGATNVHFKPFPPEPSTQPRRKSKIG